MAAQGVRGRFVSIVVIALSLGTFVAASTASAQTQYTIVGKYRQFCCNFPNDPALASAFPFPINSFPFAAVAAGTLPFGLKIREGQTRPVATITGTAGGGLQFPQSAINMQGAFSNFAPVIPNWISIATQVNVQNAAGTLVPDGRPGTGAYCQGGGGNPNCTDPADATGTITNAIMGFSEKGGGDGRFGGTMRMIGGTPGFIRRWANAAQVTSRYGNFQAPMGQIGGPFSEYQVETNTVRFYQAGVTTRTETDPIAFAGIPWGTGNVYATMTGNASPYIPNQSFSGAGYDNRTAGGLGNIQLVAASFVRGPTTDGFPTLQQMTLQVPEPGQLALLAAGAGLIGAFGWRRRQQD